LGNTRTILIVGLDWGDVLDRDMHPYFDNKFIENISKKKGLPLKRGRHGFLRERGMATRKMFIDGTEI